MTEVSWQVFKAKFAGKETSSFQELCLYVFCHICGVKTGVFSYGDHAGIETEDVLFQGKYTGFQAKFYTDNLPQKKKDILDSIIATRTHNTRVQKIFFFLPIDPPSVSKGVDQTQKPQWMKDAEATANEKGLEIEWFGTSRFKTVLACDELQVVARHFFDPNPDLWDFLSALMGITTTRLSFIRNTIPFNGEDIHIEHQHELDRLVKSDIQTITIISGIGGVGKTAIVKDWFSKYTTDRFLAVVLQPHEVIEQFCDADMSKSWHATLEDFFKMTSEKYESCVLVVDSAEKLVTGQELSGLLMVLHRFFGAGWKIVLTTRTIFEKQIVSHFQTFLPGTGLEVLNVSPIGVDELKALSVRYNFNLPTNVQMRDAIRVSFNLSAYLSCKQLSEAKSLKAFQESVWSHFVLDDTPTDTAGQTFCEYVEEKLKKDVRILNVSSPSEDTKHLVERGIIAPRENSTGYIITHDVYEEWAIVRILDGKLQELGFNEFEKYIASSHGLRRGFQLQVEQRLAGMGEDEEDSFLTMLIAPKSDILRSDLILALVRSEHIGKFLKCYSKTLLTKGTFVLESIIAGVYSFGRGLDTVPLLGNRRRPEGLSWRAIIDFSCLNQIALQEIETPTLLLLMQDWALANPEDGTGNICSNFAWKAVELGTPRYGYSYRWREVLADLILATSACDKKNFEVQIRKHITEEPDKRNAVLDVACKRLLHDSLNAPCIVAIQNFPKLVRDVAWAYWRQKRKSHEHYHELDRIEVEYGLGEYCSEYFPPSAYQGPTYLLLKVDPIKTIVFVIDFVNTCVEDAVRFDAKRFDVITLTMPDGKKVEQKISFGLWDCYRDKGYGEPVPYLLKAMHMALEKYLLDLVEARACDEVCECILWLLLQRSTSASLTAVVASVVMAHPMEFVKIGLVLIAERKVLLYDFHRHFAELRQDMSRVIFPFPKREHDYFRDEADKHPVRKVNLENLIWQYQVVASKVVPDLKARVHKILDEYAVGWDDLSLEDKFRLTRIDVRRQNLKVTVDNKTKQMLVSAEPILSDDMMERQKESIATSADTIRMIKLAQWGDKRVQGHLPSTDDEYSDLRNVLKDFQWLIDKSGFVVDSSDVVNMTAIRATAAALIMFHSDELSKELLKACERILLSSLDLIFDDHYRPVRWDRINVAIFAMPYLLPHLGWWRRYNVRQRFIMALLNEDYNDVLGGDRICDWGMAGVRVYCDRTGDRRFRKWAISAYRRHFLHYQSYVRYLMTPGAGSLIWKIRVGLCKILKMVHVSAPSWLQVNRWMAPMPHWTGLNSQGTYARSFWARHWFTTRTTDSEASHLSCNVIGFYFPTKLEIEDEHVIIADVKHVLEFLFSDERKNGCTSEHLYLTQMGRSYMKQLGYCALNMSSGGRAALLSELAKVPRALQKPELLDKLLVAQYDQQQTDNFWQLWNGLLPIVAGALASESCGHYDGQQVLDVIALTPLYWEGDERAWIGADKAILTYFDSLIMQCGSHRHLAVSIVKFICGPGKRFLLPSLKWIDKIIIQSQDEYDYGGDNARSVRSSIEKLIPLIEKRIEEINADIGIRDCLISILDYLVTQNSFPAFQMRESLYGQKPVQV